MYVRGLPFREALPDLTIVAGIVIIFAVIAGILDYVALMRLSLLFPVWLFLFAGHYWAKGSSYLPPATGLGFPFYIVFLSYSLAMASIYVINQIYDVESDRINKKLFLLPEGIIKIKDAALFAAILFLFSLAIAFIPPIDWTFRIVLLLSYLLGILYSAKPISLKDRPFLDMLSNGFGYGILNFLAGWITVKHLDVSALLHSLPYFLSVSAIFLNTTIPDINGDRAQGKRTTGVALGEGPTTRLALIFLILALFSGLFLEDYIVAATALLSLPFFAKAALTRSIDDAKVSFRIGPALLALLYGIHYPHFLILLVLTTAYLKLYYKFRFGLSYPSLKGS